MSDLEKMADEWVNSNVLGTRSSYVKAFKDGFDAAKWNQECADIADEVNHATIKELEDKIATYEAMLKSKNDDLVKALKEVGRLEFALNKGIAR